MKRYLFVVVITVIIYCPFFAQQRVGIGTTTPVAKLDIHGPFANPLIPGLNSNAILRIAVNQYESLDIGKMGGPSYAAWIQSGFNNNTADALSLQPLGGSTGIGTSSPEASAVLDITSTTQGFLPPRMTFAQRNAITAPATGLIIYCIDCDEMRVYNGTVWKNFNGTISTTPGPPNITIGTQTWMIKNLDVDRYRNGDPIPKVTDPAVWASLTIGAYCYYNNDSTTYAATYGKLYNYYAISDPRGLAPVGWDEPAITQLSTLSSFLGGNTYSGGKLKETGTVHWNAPNAGATNASGFTGLPAGKRNPDGTFSSVGYTIIWVRPLPMEVFNIEVRS